jgi:hypothetical protein
MAKMTWILIAAAAFLTGCAPAYRVHVNTFSELPAPIAPATPIYVSVDPAGQNPILRRQIASRIQVLLEGDGYRPVETPEAAAFVLTFEVGVDTERIMQYAPAARPYGAFHYGLGRPYGRRFGVGFGYTAYGPHIQTTYSHWLRMRLYDATGPEPRPPDHRTLWVGEAVVGTNDPDLRDAVNYLLVGAMEYFGTDTRQWTAVRIRRDDPRLLGIAAE